jgi:Electron transfer DM13
MIHMKKWWCVSVVVFFALFAMTYLLIWPQFQTVMINEAAPESSAVLVAPVSLFDTPAHPASGSVSIIETDSQVLLRYENLETINGPDLFVYLSTDLEATEYVNLGTLKATEGNVNYEIPAGTNIDKYRYALVWCKQFGVLFNYADLSQK